MFAKKLIAVAMIFTLAVVGMFALAIAPATVGITAVAHTTSDMSNITEMVNGLMPVFIELVFVIAIIMLIMAVIERLSKSL